MSRRPALPLAAAGILAAAGLARGDARYQTEDPGPFEAPSSEIHDASTLSPFDLDPAEGSMEDYTGWYGTPATWEEGHALDGNAGTYLSLPVGSDVLAMEAGVVVDLVDGVPPGDPNAANYVWIDHQDADRGFESTYVDLAVGVTDYVAVDDQVAIGDVVGTSDGSDDDLGPHVFIGFYEDGVAGCPFYDAYWKRGLLFFQGVLQYADAPLYADTDTGSDVVGHQVSGYAYNGTDDARDGFYRYWHPTDWGTVVQSTDRNGDVEHEEDYRESGSWTTLLGGSLAPHRIGDTARVTDAASTATFVPRVDTPGSYEVYVTWGRAANADAVTYTVTHLDGTDQVTLTQNGGGIGEADVPRVITAAPYTDSGDTEVSSSYAVFATSCQPDRDESGPDVVYRLVTGSSGTIQAAIAERGDAELDVYILADEVDGDACLAWGESQAQVGGAAAGTYYVVVDTPDEGAPGAYDLTVTYSGTPAGDSAGPEMDADRWHLLGTYRFEEGKDAAGGAVTLEVAEGVGPVVDSPVRAQADAVLLLNTDRLFYAQGEGGEGSTVAEAILLLKSYASLVITSEDSWPVHTEPYDDAPVLFRARRGQRFLAESNWEGWYEIWAPGLAGEIGYLHEDCCTVYSRRPEKDLDDWSPGDDDDDDSAAGDDDGDGCKCSSSSAPAGGVGASAALLVCLATALGSRRRTRAQEELRRG